MVKRYNKIAVVCICISLLTGCWDYRDIDRKSIVQSVGVDAVDDKIEFSGEITKITKIKDESQQSSQLKGVYRLLSYGKNYEEARIDHDAINPYPLFLGAIRVVAFGTNYAKQGIEPYLNRLNKFYDYRKTVLIVVTRERPKELFSMKSDRDISIGFLIEDMLSSLKSQSMALYPSIGELLSDISFGNIGYMLPYIGIEYGAVKYLGLAVMNDSKLVGVMKIEDTDGVLYLLAKHPFLTEVIELNRHENNRYSLDVEVKKRKIKTEYINDKVVINVDLNSAAGLQYQYHTHSLSDKDIKQIENIVSSKIKNDILKAFKRSQTEFKCDIFGFAKYFRADNPKIYDEIDWKDEYLNADINVNVKTKIKNLGLIDPNAKRKY